jgi:NAD(P)-dependent dehydrogenase (short-subunit alcohol dehydrogenase family)
MNMANELQRDDVPKKGDSSLHGKVALVTGAGGSIGRAIALALGHEGAQTVLTDIDEPSLQETAAAVRANGAEARTLPLDVRSEAQWRDCMAAIREDWAQLHILVNNAGVCAPTRLMDLTYESWRWHLDVELDGKFLGCKYAIPLMVDSGGGSIVNIGSISGRVPVSGLAAYATGKAGVTALTRAIAADCAAAGFKIRANSILPGGTRSAIWIKMAHGGMLPEGGDPDGEALLTRQTKLFERTNPSRRPGYPEDIAKAVVFLASDQSSYINATELVVDGGSSGIRAFASISDLAK